MTANEKLSRPLWVNMTRQERAWYKTARRRWLRRVSNRNPEDAPNEKQFAGWAD